MLKGIRWRENTIADVLHSHRHAFGPLALFGIQRLVL
jgi:hypothetical protein